MHNNKSKKTNLKINIRNDAISNDVNFVVDLKGDIETRKKQEQGKSPSVKFEHLWIGLKTRAKKLLIVRLIKFIYNSIASLFNLIYEFNYSVGWLVIFVVRFFWFLGLSILKLFGLPFKVLKPSYKKKEKSKLVRTFKWELFNFKKVLYLAMFLFVAVIPFKVLSFYTKLSIETKKENIINSSKMAIDNFMGAANAAMSMDFNGVDKNLSEANNSFLTAQRQLDDINGFLFTLAAIVPSKNLQLASISRNILVSGQISTDLALDLNAAIENLLDNKKNKSIYFALENFNIYANKAMQESKLLSIQLGKIDPSLLPSEYQAKFIATKDKMALMEGGLKDLIDIANGLHEILGMTEDKRYLLVFQNNTEARATGGFIGSYALADFRNGKIKNLEIPEGGSYDTEGGMRVAVRAPEPLSLVNPIWHFWDANWWPNWPTSAEKMMWFYEKSDGPSVDGVISFTPTFFENLLKIIGPVDLPDYHLTISSDNFLDTIQAVVEKQPGKDDAAFINSDANKPKKIIGDLAQVVIEVLPKRLDKNKLIALIGTVEQSLKEKQVLFYFKDQLLQDKAVQYGWDGSIKNTAFDYLSVVNTNIAGQKTDKVIDQEITHDAQVDQSGKVIVTLKIKRIHNGKKGDIFTGVRNVDWLRVYVPLGSHLIEANGFRLPDQTYFEKSDRALAVDKDLINETNAEVDVSSGTKIYEESSKTVFANWSMIDPGESADIVFKYELPFKIYKDNSQEKEDRWSGLKKILKMEEIQLIPYTLLVQKQAGAKSVKFISNLTLPKSMSAVWRYPTGSLVNHSGWTINEDLNIDKYWAVLIQE